MREVKTWLGQAAARLLNIARRQETGLCKPHVTTLLQMRKGAPVSRNHGWLRWDDFWSDLQPERALSTYPRIASLLDQARKNGLKRARTFGEEVSPRNSSSNGARQQIDESRRHLNILLDHLEVADPRSDMFCPLLEAVATGLYALQNKLAS
jgi:hypothetical protein